MTGPTRAPATLAADLAALSERATEGWWADAGVWYRTEHDGNGEVTLAHPTVSGGLLGTHMVAETWREGREDSAYIAALVNAHRAGHLVTLDAALDWVAERVDVELARIAWEAQCDATLDSNDPLWHVHAGLTAALAALRDRAAPRAPQPDTTHDTEEP